MLQFGCDSHPAQSSLYLYSYFLLPLCTFPDEAICTRERVLYIRATFSLVLIGAANRVTDAAANAKRATVPRKFLPAKKMRTNKRA